VFSECKDFGFKDQICQAAVSIPSNVAEGYERNSPGDFTRFLNIAKGSAGELRTHLYIARELGYTQGEIKNVTRTGSILRAVKWKMSRYFSFRPGCCETMFSNCRPSLKKLRKAEREEELRDWKRKD